MKYQNTSLTEKGLAEASREKIDHMLRISNQNGLDPLNTNTPHQWGSAFNVLGESDFQCGVLYSSCSRVKAKNAVAQPNRT